MPGIAHCLIFGVAHCCQIAPRTAIGVRRNGVRFKKQYVSEDQAYTAGAIW